MKPWAALLCLASCATLESTARDQFVHDASCPANRVAVKNDPPEAAPPDIAADPGRLAVWSEDAAQKAKHHLVASGCGQERHYVCDTQSADGASWPDCTPAPAGLRKQLEEQLQKVMGN